jgi:hypothetical protein
MTDTVSEPGNPGPPAFTINVPSGWQSVDTTEASLAALDTSGTVFQSNITVDANPFTTTLSLADIAEKVIASRDDRLTQHNADEPIHDSSNDSLRWTSTFVVALKGEPLVLKQWTLLLDQPQPETAPVRYVTVATLTMLASEADNDLAEQLLASLKLA